MVAPNNTLQVTFDLLRPFAAAKAHIASNTPERGQNVRFPKVGNGSKGHISPWAEANTRRRGRGQRQRPRSATAGHRSMKASTCMQLSTSVTLCCYWLSSLDKSVDSAPYRMPLLRAKINVLLGVDPSWQGTTAPDLPQ